VLERGDSGPLGSREALGRPLPGRCANWPVLTAARRAALEGRLETIAEESSERERAAEEAERELLAWKQAEFMGEKLGEHFDGRITAVRDYGLHVELAEVFVEGLVHVSTLVDDLYLLRERDHALVGQQRRRIFRLGDGVRVRVDRVDRGRHLVDFSIVE
jgi:ribonuclease R